MRRSSSLKEPVFTEGSALTCNSDECWWIRSAQSNGWETLWQMRIRQLFSKWKETQNTYMGASIKTYFLFFFPTYNYSITPSCTCSPKYHEVQSFWKTQYFEQSGAQWPFKDDLKMTGICNFSLQPKKRRRTSHSEPQCLNGFEHPYLWTSSNFSNLPFFIKKRIFYPQMAMAPL